MHRKSIKWMLVLMFVLAMVISVNAYDSGPAVSRNINTNHYISSQRWAAPIDSTLTPEGDGFIRVEHINGSIVIEKYDQNLNFVSGRTLGLELPIYGGVYMCEDYNFVVVGQNNPLESDQTEVIRIIRYSKDWVRQASASVYGANTRTIFSFGSLRMDRSGNMLYIRTAHEMYAGADGVNHQANVMLAVRISDMTVTDRATDTMNINYGYVSHSFNQFVRVDGTDLLAVDHGDYYPRSVVLFKYNAPAGREQFRSSKASYVQVLPIVDSTGQYYDTGVSVGGFECSDTDYLVAGCSYNQKKPADLMNVQRNIFVTATSKSNFSEEGTTTHWLTAYTAEDNVAVSPPHLVKIGENSFVLIWTENDVLKYCYLDGSGEIVGKIATGTGALSECVPVLADGRIVWYVTDNSAPVFYEIRLRLGTPVAKASNKASTGKPVITWEPVDGAVKYEIHRATSKNGAFTRKATTTNTTYTNSGAEVGKCYYYFVRAFAADGTYKDSKVVSRTCDLARPAVKVTNKASTGKLVISWDAVEGAAKYELYRSDSKTGTYTRLITTSGTTVTNSSTTAGKTYYYKVRAICNVEAATGAYSEVKSGTCDLAQPVVKVSNVASTGKIKVSWEKVSGAVKYEVYRAASKSGTYSKLIATESTVVTDTSATAGKTYYYKVRAIAERTAANSAYSEIKSRTCDLPRPEVSVALSSGKPKVSWVKLDGATSYKVYRATSRDGTYSLVKTSTGSYYKDTNATAGKTYYYKVVAVCSNTSGNSAYSSVVSIKSK